MITPTRRLPLGFTLIELMVVVAIAAILAALALPSFTETVDKYRLRGAADNLYGDLQFSRMEAVRKNQSVILNFSTGGSWCYGMKLGSNCDCTKSSSEADYCSLKLVRYLENTGITLTSQTFLSSPSFDPLQGLSSQAGDIVLVSSRGRQTQVSLTRLGMASVCTPAGANSAGYSSC